MTDIVERLRDHDRHVRGRLIEGLPDLCIDDMIEAAEEIERLRKELKHAHALADTLRRAIGVTGWTPSAALGEGKE